MLRYFLLAAMLLAAPSLAAQDNPPIPLPKPDTPDSDKPAEVPTPEKKPDQSPPIAGDKPSPPTGEKEKQAPARPEGQKAEPAAKKSSPPPPPPPIESEDAAALEVCTKDLKALGAEFKPLPRVDDGKGCGIAKPIETTRLSAAVGIEPALITRCETALQLARMTRDFIAPAAALGLPDMGQLKTVHQASGYVCRKRNGANTGKISEHARGNAIDIAALDFEKGSVSMMIARQKDSDLGAAFQRALNAFACLYFTTVLSPGSDSAHQDHMHLDILERKSGYRYCR